MDLGWSVLPDTSYDTNLASTDYYVFRSLQNSLIGKTFSNANHIQEFAKFFFTSKSAYFTQNLSTIARHNQIIKLGLIIIFLPQIHYNMQSRLSLIISNNC